MNNLETPTHEQRRANPTAFALAMAGRYGGEATYAAMEQLMKSDDKRIALQAIASILEAAFDVDEDEYLIPDDLPPVDCYPTHEQRVEALRQELALAAQQQDEDDEWDDD